MAANNEDWEVEHTEKPEEEEADTVTYQISYYPADFTLKGYIDKDDAGQLQIPPFQRNYVWDQSKASKLIESFLLGLPVPGVFLYKERNTNKLLVIDGQQRIKSAIQFFRGYFEDRVFRLKNVHPRWEGKNYQDLDEADQFQLNDAVLRATVIQQLDPNDDSSVYQIFERLNTGGVNLNPMEVRKCVYFGDFYRSLEALNVERNWRRLLGKPLPDKRLRDVELILRVTALWKTWRTYEKPMKRFLNAFMSSVNRLPDAERTESIHQLERRFQAAVQAVTEQLPERAFHLRGRLNYAALDCFLSACMEHHEALGDKNLDEIFTALRADDGFIDSVSVSTSDERVVRQRFETVYAAFDR